MFLSLFSLFRGKQSNFFPVHTAPRFEISGEMFFVVVVVVVAFEFNK